MNEIIDEIEFLGQFILDQRKQRVEEVLNFRTKQICLVLEDIYQSQNASAILRSADSFGVLDIHIIENQNPYILNPLVTQGCDKWLNLIRYSENEDNTQACINELKSNGYKIVATSLDDFDYTLDELPVDEKLAIVFGTEKTGVSKTLFDASDLKMKIPMFGFSQSFNVSVSAAVTLSNLISRLHQSNIKWKLTDSEILELRLLWYKKITDIENKIHNSKTSIN